MTPRRDSAPVSPGAAVQTKLLGTQLSRTRGLEVEARLHHAARLLRHSQAGRLDQALAVAGATALVERAHGHLVLLLRELLP